jgi:hypothetical protein
MCQLKAVVERQDGSRETVMDSVTSVNVTPEGVVLSTYFEEPLTVPDAWIRSIDFLSGSVLLAVRKSAS